MPAVSTGSSAKHSNPRPPSGVRIKLIVGPSSTSTPLLLASAPSAAASSCTSPVSQVAPRADGQGRLEDGLRSSLTTPRTPAGPSDVVIGRRPRALAPWVRQLSAPVSRSTLSATESAATRLASVIVPVAAPGWLAASVPLAWGVVSGLTGPAIIAGLERWPSGPPPGRPSARWAGRPGSAPGVGLSWLLRLSFRLAVRCPAQEAGLRWRTVSSRYGEPGVGFMNGLLADSQPT